MSSLSHVQLLLLLVLLTFSSCTGKESATQTSVHANGHTAQQTLIRSHAKLAKANDASNSSNFIAALDREKCNIFSLWEKPEGRDVHPPFPRLVIEAWRRHSAGICNEPVLITDDNVRQIIPDLPAEYFKLPYSAAKSDFIRYAVLYHHGGIYLDFDMLTMGDIDNIVSMMKQHDLVSYSDAGNKQGTTCPTGFSSNFMASRKQSPFHKAVWEAQKVKLTKHCDLKDKQKEIVCCFDEDEKCHIPWGGLGEGISHPVFESLMKKQPFETRCFNGDDSFLPDGFTDVLDHVKLFKDAEVEFKKRSVERPFDRQLYHFFNALFHMEQYSCEHLFDEKTVVGHFMRKSFNSGRGTTPRNTGPEAEQFLKDHPEFIKYSTNGATLPDGTVLPCKPKEMEMSVLEH